MKKISLLLLIVMCGILFADTTGTNYRLKSDNKIELTVTGSRPLLGDLDFNGNDLIDGNSINADDVNTPRLSHPGLGNGFLRASGGDGTLVTDSNVYLTSFSETDPCFLTFLALNPYNDANWNTAYTHSQIAGGDSVHVSTAENTNWDTAYSYSTVGHLPLAGGTLTGNLLFTDNAYDIGESGAARPRKIYVGTGIVTSTIESDTGTVGFTNDHLADITNITASSAVQGGTVIGTTSVTGATVITGTGGINVNGGTGSLVAIKAQTDDSASGFRIIDYDTTHIPLFAWQANDAGTFILRNANANKVVLRSDDTSYFLSYNFGIGTTSPDTALQVVGDAKIGDDNTNYVTIGTTGNQTFTGSAGFYPRVLNQTAEPAAGTGATQLDTGEMCIWTDTDDSKCYFCYNHGGTVKTVEMN